MPDHSINVGNVTGTGIAIGYGASARVQITPQQHDEILALLTQLRADIQAAPINEGAKKVILRDAIPEMEAAVETPAPQSGIEGGLKKINDHLESANAAAGNVANIVSTVTKIAGVVGLAVKSVTPFLARLF
jgi:hypothetical protein